MFIGRLWDRDCGDRGAEILELGSHRRETLPKRVSNDSGRFVFQRQKKNRKFQIENFVFHQFGVVFDEPWPSGPQNQLPRRNALDTLIEMSVHPKIADSVSDPVYSTPVP